RLVLRERVDDGGVGVGDQEHVRLLDLLEAADRRAVEAEAVLEHVLAQLVRGDREVLHQPREVAEADVDDVDLLVGEPLQHVTGSRHASPPFSVYDEGPARGTGKILSANRASVECLGVSLRYASALQTVSVIMRVTTYGSMLALGRRSSM